MEKILNFENINKLEEIQSEIETQKSYKFLGYLLIPLIFGIFIIKRTNTNISILSTEKEKLTHHVINDIEKLRVSKSLVLENLIRFLHV